MKLKSIVKAGVIAAVVSCAGVVSAQVTAAKNINVTVTLTPQCRVATGSSGTIALAFGTYTAFGAAVDATPATVNFECTRGRVAAPTFAWDGAEAFGTVNGLRYTLDTTNGTLVAGAEPTAGSSTSIGSPDTRPVTINGNMPAGQAGNSGTGSATRTLTVTF